MEPCSKYISMCDIFSDDNTIPKKMRKKNWYMTEEKMDDISKRTIKPRKNLTSKSSRVSSHKGLDNVISIPQRIVHESTSFKASMHSPKQVIQRQYPTTSKNKPTNSNLKPISSTSYTSSMSSDSSHNAIIADQKNIKTAMSSFNMKRLASQISNAGRKLIKLAATMDVGKIDECDINFTEKKGDLKMKKLQNTYHEKNNSRNNNNKEIAIDKSRVNDSSDVCPDVNRNNCCSSRQYLTRRFKPTSTQLRANKSKRIQRVNIESNHPISKNDSFNSIHSVDGHPRRQHRNEVHSSLDRSITPSIVLDGLHPENSSTKNVRMTAYNGVMSSLNRKKKINKNPRMKKTDWKFDDIDFLDEDIF